MPSEEVQLWLQSELAYFIIPEEQSAISFIGGPLDEYPDGTASRWQFGVDMIHRLLKSGLVRFDHAGLQESDTKTFVELLANENPFASGAFTWHTALLYGTERCAELMTRHDAGDWKDDTVSKAFSDEIASIFETNGVGWSGKTFVAIRDGAPR
jgi:hypothetical protein